MYEDRIMFRELKRIDPVLMKRCQSTLAESGGRIFDADDLTDALRRKFPEYDRRKRAVFRPLVTEYFRVLEVVGVETEANRTVSKRRAKDTPKNSNTLTETDDSKTRASRKRKDETDIDAEVEQALVKKKRKEREKEVSLLNATITFADMGGLEKELVEVVHLLTHMKHPEIYSGFGILPPRGFLIHGPPGCGKTMLVSAIAGQLKLPLLKVSAPEIVAGVSGESEQRIRELFEQAVNCAPCVFFIDEIDAVTPRRETAQREMEKRIVAQLLTCIDDLCSRELDKEVLLIGATHRLDSLDPALRRAGRFNREVSLGIPTEASRSSILRILCKSLRLESDFDFDRIAHLTPGLVGADLQDLTREATSIAVKRLIKSIESRLENAGEEISRTKVSIVKTESRTLLDQSLKMLMSDWNLSQEELDNLKILQKDFLDAIQIVQPSAKREGFATVPGVTWKDVGAMTDIRETLNVYILAAVKHREKYEALGLNTSTGILMHGPPGCGKTLIAKAVANESGINFISVKGPELLNMYVGESEKAIRQVFQRARASAPCVIFFDELDALCPRRSDSSDGGSTSRVVNQLLTEMDGLESRKQVFVLAATNRPDIIDPAMLRPGRLDHIIHVGLPDRDDREDILRALTRNATKPKIEDMSLASIADLTETFSGAELASLVKTASISALTQQLKIDPDKSVILREHHFQEALEKMGAAKRKASENKTGRFRS